MDKLAVIKPQQKLILQKMKGLPPSGWLVNDCHTPEQKNHWRDCRSFFQFLRSMLEDYFSGEATDLSRFSKKDQKFWFRYRDFWLQVYSLISENWVEIRQESRALGIKVKKTGLPKNPGQMFAAIIEGEAAAWFYLCTEYASPEISKFSPATIYKELGDWTGQKYKRMTKEQFREEHQFVAWLDLCLGACERVAKHDSEIQEKLKRLSSTSAELNLEMRPMVHSSKQVKGYIWVNGEKKTLT